MPRASKDPSGFFEQPLQHSLVKVEIVHKYFRSWANIIKRRTRRMAYVDLYAGPGAYEDGTPSTPLRILTTIIQDQLLREQTFTFFSDEAPDIIDALRANVSALPGINTLKFSPRIEAQRAQDTGLATHFQEASIIPSLMFLDPFGYEGVTASLIRAILKDWGCDVIFFFCFARMPGALNNDAVRHHVDELFGASRVDALRKLLPTLPTHQRESAILSALEQSLNSIGGTYVQVFRFRNSNGYVTHHLVFITKDKTAHKIMKEIMAAASSGDVDGVKDFEFTTAPSLGLVVRSPIEDLMDDLLVKFAGKTPSLESIFESHQYGTPYIPSNYQEAVRRLVYDRRVVAAKRVPMKPPLRPGKRDMPFEGTLITFP